METLVESNPLINLNCDQLLARCDDLVDKATRDALKHCYEELFKEAVMKCVLKQVLKEEIQHLSREKEADWKRVAFVDKISCLTQASRDTEKPKAATPRRNDKQTGISTDKLLLSGYLRTEMDTADNHHFPVEILSVCQHFFGDCSNMIAPNQLIIYHHDEDLYSSVFDESKRNMKAVQLQSATITADSSIQLIAPYKVAALAEQAESISVRDDFHQQLDAAEISVNVQTIGTLPYYGRPSNKELTKPKAFGHRMYGSEYAQSNASNRFQSTAAAIHGVTQFFDRARLRLLNIGGSISKPEPSLSDVVYSMPLTSANLPDMFKQFHTAYKRRNVSLCDVDQSQLAIIGGQGRAALFGPSEMYRPVGEYPVVDWVEMYDLKTDESVAVKNLNHARAKCGTYYNKQSESIVVFGGTEAAAHDLAYYNNYYGSQYGTQSPLKVDRIMEIYDFQRNIWLEIPDKTCHSFADYPCIWSVGGQCIFVAEIASNRSAIHCEWIDLREAAVNGTNKSRFYSTSQPLSVYIKDQKVVMLINNVSQSD